MDNLASEWQRKGPTLSGKTARKQFGLTQDEIVQATRAGKLHYRLNSIFGSSGTPFCGCCDARSKRWSRRRTGVPT